MIEPPTQRANRSAGEAAAAAARRPAVVAELAQGVSIDVLLRTRAQGPNKQDAP